MFKQPTVIGACILGVSIVVAAAIISMSLVITSKSLPRYEILAASYSELPVAYKINRVTGKMEYLVRNVRCEILTEDQVEK